MSAVSLVLGLIRSARGDEGRACPPGSLGPRASSSESWRGQREFRRERPRSLSGGRRLGALVLFLAAIVGTSWTALAAWGLVAQFTRSAPSELAPLEVRFDASSSRVSGGRIAFYQWTFGDDFSGSGVAVVHRYAVDGTYLVTLLIGDGQGQVAKLEALIHVSGSAEVFPFGTGVGQAAPLFELPDLEGVPVRLADFRGRLVLLDFWGTWCPTCTKTLAILEDFRRRHEDDGLVLVGVTSDKDATTPADYLRANGFLDFVCLWGSLKDARAVQELYSVTGVPHVFLIDRLGVIRFTGKPEELKDADIQPWL